MSHTAADVGVMFEETIHSPMLS